MSKNGELQEAQQNSTEKTIKLTPTEGMKKWFIAATNLGYTASITDIAKEAKIDRTNWYLWLDKPGFVEWWDNKWQHFLGLSRWKLDAIGMKKAEEGYNYWKDMMNRTGNVIPETPQTANQFNVVFKDYE